MVPVRRGRYQRDMFKRFWWLFPLGLVLGPVVGVVVAGLIAYLQPKQYESKAVVQVRPVMPVVGTRAGEDPVAGNLLATAFETLGSGELLGKVAADLDLATRWAIDDPVERLRSMVTASNIRGTDLIEVRVRSTSAGDSMQIANQLLEEFVRTEGAAAKERREKELAELRGASAAQERVVEEKRRKLTAIIRDGGITYSPDGPSADVEGDKDAFDQARADFEIEQSKLEQLKVREVSGEMQSRIGDSFPIVHAEATMPSRPAAPNVPLQLLVGAGAGGLLGILGAFVLIPGLHGLTKPRVA